MSITEQLDEFKQWLNDKQRTGMRLAEAFHDIVQRYEAALRTHQQPEAQAPQGEVAVPLDYLQGHAHGLEWAACIVEADDPRTGDWLYDDRNDLAAAIRRGPELPPATQPAAGQAAEWCANCGEGTTQGLCRAKPADPECRFVAGQAAGVVGLSDEQVEVFHDAYQNDRRILGDFEAFAGVARDIWGAAHGIRPAGSEGASNG